MCFTSPDSFPELEPHLYNQLSNICLWKYHGTFKSTWLNGAHDSPPTPVLSPLLDGAAIHPMTTPDSLLSLYLHYKLTLLIWAMKYTQVNYISIRLEKNTPEINHLFSILHTTDILEPSIVFHPGLVVFF